MTSEVVDAARSSPPRPVRHESPFESTPTSSSGSERRSIWREVAATRRSSINLCVVSQNRLTRTSKAAYVGCCERSWLGIESNSGRARLTDDGKLPSTDQEIPSGAPRIEDAPRLHGRFSTMSSYGLTWRMKRSGGPSPHWLTSASSAESRCEPLLAFRRSVSAHCSWTRPQGSHQ